MARRPRGAGCAVLLQEERVRSAKRLHKYIGRGFVLSPKYHDAFLCFVANGLQRLYYRHIQHIRRLWEEQLEQFPALSSYFQLEFHRHFFVVKHPTKPSLSFPVFGNDVTPYEVDHLPVVCKGFVDDEQPVDDLTITIGVAEEGQLPAIVTCYDNIDQLYQASTVFYPCYKVETERGWEGLGLQGWGISDSTGQPRLVTIHHHDGEFTVSSSVLEHALQFSRHLIIEPTVIAEFPFTTSEDVIQGVANSMIGGNHCQLGSKKLLYHVKPAVLKRPS